MKTKLIQLIMLCMIALIPAAIFAQDIAPAAPAAAATEAATGLSDTIINYALIAAVWYGAACAAFNGLVALVSTVVRRTPGDSDDKAVDKFYNTGLYKAVAWIFSWGDYIGEFITKLKK